MTWLVTGGAGYIGSHVVRAFRNEGIDCVVLDDLSSGHRGFVPEDVPLRRAASLVDRAAGRRDPRRARRRAASCTWPASSTPVSRSVARCTPTPRTSPARSCCSRRWPPHGVERIVFSSSAAVYGTPDIDLVTEETPTRPESPYGESKLIGEWLLRDQARATALRAHVAALLQRGRLGTPDLRDTSPHNLFPIVFEQLVAGKIPHINGDDYPTAGRHLRPRLRARGRSRRLPRGRGQGAGRRGRRSSRSTTSAAETGLSVRQIMDAVARVTGIDFTADVQPRRPGDPAPHRRRPASWRPATSTGRCGTRSTTWSARPGRPAKPPRDPLVSPLTYISHSA